MPFLQALPVRMVMAGRADLIGFCRRCPIYKYANNNDWCSTAVFGPFICWLDWHWVSALSRIDKQHCQQAKLGGEILFLDGSRDG